MPSPDKVLRLVAAADAAESEFIPSTPAMALVLRHGEKGTPPSLDVIRASLARPPPSTSG
jgi:hypothetical protein